MMSVISVRPEGSSWAVEAEQAENKLVFPSGAAAENAAKALAERLVQFGKAAEIRIHLKDGRLGARFLCPSQELEWV
jgi:hypothetical protein